MTLFSNTVSIDVPNMLFVNKGKVYSSCFSSFFNFVFRLEARKFVFKLNFKVNIYRTLNWFIFLLHLFLRKSSNKQMTLWMIEGCRGRVGCRSCSKILPFTQLSLCVTILPGYLYGTLNNWHKFLLIWKIKFSHLINCHVETIKLIFSTKSGIFIGHLFPSK